MGVGDSAKSFGLRQDMPGIFSFLVDWLWKLVCQRAGDRTQD